MKRLRSPAAIGTLVLCALAATSVCLWLLVVRPLPASDVALLERMPEATLYYPGSYVHYAGGSSDALRVINRDPTIYSTTLATNDSRERVVAFYDAELTRTGWSTVARGDVVSNSSESAAFGWQRGGVLIRLSFATGTGWLSESPLTVYATVYYTKLVKR